MKLHTTLMAACCLASQAVADPARLEEVLVTAELRPALLLSQVGSISVISAEDIREREAQHLEGVLSLAPNVNFAGGTSRARFFQIRGVGERSQFQEPLNPSIGLVIDGIDFSGLGGAGTLFDVQQVEILRGPQGTLHGANALAGLIDIRSGEPEAEPALRVEAGAADYDSWNVGVVGTGPLLTDQLLFRLAVNRFHSDGFIENDYLGRDDTNGQDETTLRGKLRWLPTGRDTVDLTAMYIDIDNGYDAFSLDNTRHTLSDEPGKDRQDSRALGLEWRRELDALTVETSVTGATTASTYSFDEDWSYVGIAPGWEYSSKDRYKRDRDSYSATARVLSTESSRLLNDSTDWVAGAYFLGDSENLQRRYTYLENDFSSRYDTDTYALFGQLDSQLSERFKLITGLRIERRLTGVDARIWVGLTAATEHFTAFLSDHLLRHPQILAGAEPRLRDLWLWHASEETEHRSTAFDLYRTLGGDERWRRRLYWVVTLQFALDLTRQMAHNLWRDGHWWRPSTWVDAARFLFGRDGVVRHTWRPWRRYFAADFHPSEGDDAVAAGWLAAHADLAPPVQAPVRPEAA